ncbi:MAG: hypothetical protein NZ585_05550 [Chloracidobacterium sp.]|nr:hypothetical protein [Chloracidobacterium sp.]MDW8217619.1 hypothetical protein [Acidobacteriota bacterium]
MEGVAVLGTLLFLLIFVVSCGFEVYELYYDGRRALEDGRQSSDSLLLPRRYYADLHQRTYGLARFDGSAQTFRVRRAERPARCEVCHQGDRFEAQTGYCTRCRHYTL